MFVCLLSADLYRCLFCQSPYIHQPSISLLMSIFLSVCLSLCLSVCRPLFICLSVCLCDCLSICMIVHIHKQRYLHLILLHFIILLPPFPLSFPFNYSFQLLLLFCTPLYQSQLALYTRTYLPMSLENIVNLWRIHNFST